MATSSIVLVILRWPTLSDLARYLSPMRRYPSIFWTDVAFLLLLIAMIHAQNRIQCEQAQLSKEHGWQFSKDWSPIEDSDWQKLSQHSGLAALSSAKFRCNYTYGNHAGVAFVLFEAPGRRVQPEIRGNERMIAFHKPAQQPRAPSLAVGAESAAWKKVVTDNWVFLRRKTPQWAVPSERIAKFVAEAYEQFLDYLARLSFDLTIQVFLPANSPAPCETA